MSKLQEPAGCNTVGMVSFVMGLLGGTGSSIVIKVLYELRSPGLDGEMRYFEKPLFLTFVMFLAMAFALPIYWLQQRLKAPEKRPKPVPRRVLLWLVIPSIFDLAGTNFAQIGLVFTTVSYFQLLRCTVIIVTAFLKAFVLKQRLMACMWCGVAINIVAMVLVSMTNFLSADGDQMNGLSNAVLGTVFILLSCVVQGSQYIFEEKVMAVDDAPPLVVIGMEGIWGTLIMFGVCAVAAALPGRDMGSLENTWDSLRMVANSYTIQMMLLVFFTTITTYNIFCIYVTAYLSAIWHAILDNFRPVSVWGLDLLIFYVITDGAFGEAWTEYSWLQFAGMMLLFFGTAVYNGSTRLPFLSYEATGHAMRAPDSLSSPALMTSPLLRRLSSEYESPGTSLMQASRAFSRRKAEARRASEYDMEHGERQTLVSKENSGGFGNGISNGSGNGDDSGNNGGSGDGDGDGVHAPAGVQQGDYDYQSISHDS